MPNLEMNNGQRCRASLTVLDLKGKPITTLPPSATVAYTVSDAQIAQWAEDAPNALTGVVTTHNDDVGVCDISGTITWGDGATKESTLHVTVLNSAPGSVEFTAGTPESDDEIPPAEGGGDA